MENTKMKDLRKKINAALNDFNGAIGDSSLTTMNDARAEIDDLLKQYQAEALSCFIKEVKKSENPLIDAVTQLKYDSLRFKESKEKGVVTGGTIEETKVSPNWVQVCDRLDISTAWQYAVEAYARLISIRVAKDIECKDADIKELSEKFRMTSEARKKITQGKDPFSNNQLVKDLQAINDEIFGSIGKVNNKDLAYIRECFTKKGRETGTVNLGTGKLMINLVFEVAHNIITGDAYRVAYKKVKEKKAKTEEQKSEVTQVERPAA